MKSLNKALREWLLERRGRGMALAKKLNCSKQYISEISKMEPGFHWRSGMKFSGPCLKWKAMSEE